jgi:prolyl-tRNA synthetase
MGATVLDADGRSLPMVMGCYGIGVTRVIAAAIEQNHDERGIIWPAAIAPFDVVVIPINMDKSAKVAESTHAIHEALDAAGFDVLVDDRPQRPGFRFADADLIGFPHRIVVSDKTLEHGNVEYKQRSSQETELVPVENLDRWLAERN